MLPSEWLQIESRLALRLASSGVREVPLQDGFRIGIGLLQIHAPIFQLLQRDRHAGHRAAYECAGPHHAEVTIEIFDLGLTRHGGSVIGSATYLLPRHGWRS